MADSRNIGDDQQRDNSGRAGRLIISDCADCVAGAVEVRSTGEATNEDSRGKWAIGTVSEDSSRPQGLAALSEAQRQANEQNGRSQRSLRVGDSA
jgi:hypothetical protein